MTKKKILSILLSAVLMLTIAMPAFAADDTGITPYLEPHCSKGNLLLKSIDTVTTYNTRVCQHGAVGRYDKQAVSQDLMNYKCTGCAFVTTYRAPLVYGNRYCV